jgi:endonuclease YncB( thermonuclease family)
LESRTRDDEEKVKGLAAKARLTELLDTAGNVFLLKSHGVGKFGRCLGELFVDGNTGDRYGQSINKLLIEEGHAKEYDGGKR